MLYNINLFYTLQCSLLDLFPLEAGTYDPSRRTIPFLPGILLRFEIVNSAHSVKLPADCLYVTRVYILGYVKMLMPSCLGKKLVGNLNEKTAEKRRSKFDVYLKVTLSQLSYLFYLRNHVHTTNQSHQ